MTLHDIINMLEEHDINPDADIPILIKIGENYNQLEAINVYIPTGSSNVDAIVLRTEKTAFWNEI